MKTVFILILLFNSTLWAKYQKPYFKKNGKMIQGHFKTAPNNTRLDNYSTKPNVGPSGKKGTK